ncbi:WD40-repeat-containing domain protein [Entophlyctis helioformis]|nr:WD40-repeat-containing domain protein [Entophlyctis helioformis]
MYGDVSNSSTGSIVSGTSASLRQPSLQGLPGISLSSLCFTAPEGVYRLREHISADTEPTGALLPSLRTGTALSIVQIKSSDSGTSSTPGTTATLTAATWTSSSAPLHDVAGKQAIAPRFVDVPINGDGSGSFQFLKGAKNAVKKAKPQLTKSSTPFVWRIIANENLAKLLSFRPPETTYMFYNVGRAFLWTDYLSNTSNLLSVVQFREAIVTCHDVNKLTRDNLDTALGFSTGDILWYSPISGKFARFNKQGSLHKHAVSSITWVPGSETEFMAGFEDGSIIVFNRDLDEQAFNTQPTDDEFYISRNAKPKYNPVAVWKAGRKAITAMAFSADCQHVAVASMDGTLKIADYANSKLLDLYRSYFGGLLCVAWSPDGRYIVAGGQDDLLSIWGFRGKLVAWCQGHSSWVTSIAFDNHRCTDRNYRFGSVGEDARICLWDFSMSSLPRPRTMYGSLSRNRPRLESGPDTPVHHSAPKKGQVPTLESYSQFKFVHDGPASSISFRDDCIVTADKMGNLRIWNRPIAEQPTEP